ncbi:HAD family hydrolase [Ornithinimicrobium faecis]|uniref:HAD family hydrolase n=1 Tax=Ornithinimicrobium faecis TaxID=2934158 RepID=UPI002118EE7A|nr:HAD-IIIA family hydrolase [Ornithinimicrobium sp. HY1745]
MPNAPVSLPAPRGMLLDFGGVIIETAKRPTGRAEVVTHLAGLLDRAGQPVPTDQLRASLDAALTALKAWKNASSRRPEPRELSHREIVGDFLAADLPDAARAILVGHAPEILEVMGDRISEHHLRPGIPELLSECAARGIPIGIVSNAHSGRHHRRILDDLGLGHRFAVQVYSDEVGIRKPHPGMIDLAAEALGLTPADCWYVGDTQDRDVVVGRRAGVAAVLVTRTRHTDNPPFAVTAQADGTFDTPEGVLATLRASRETAVRQPGPSRPTRTRRGAPPTALLLDHGGVVSTSQSDPDAAAVLGAHLSDLLSTGGLELSPETATTMVRDGVASYRATKHLLDGAQEVPQPGPATLWADHVGADAPERVRAVLRAHAHDLMHRWYTVKAEHILRQGMRALLELCRDQGIPVVLVSNTVSGRGVRERLVGHGLEPLISGYVFSDEVGRRKPDVALIREALTMVDAPASACWFLGDQARTDGVAAHIAGIGRRVLTRGGKGSNETLQRALDTGLVTDLIDSPADLIPLLTATLDHPPHATAYPTPEHTPDTQRTA